MDYLFARSKPVVRNELGHESLSRFSWRTQRGVFALKRTGQGAASCLPENNGGSVVTVALDFPDGFLWGRPPLLTRSKVPQKDGRGPSIWDAFCHTPGKIFHGDTGDIACGHYERWEQDVVLIAGLGLNVYRLSVAWPSGPTRRRRVVQPKRHRLLPAVARQVAGAWHKPRRHTLPLGPAPSPGGERWVGEPGQRRTLLRLCTSRRRSLGRPCPGE